MAIRIAKGAKKEVECTSIHTAQETYSQPRDLKQVSELVLALKAEKKDQKKEQRKAKDQAFSVIGDVLQIVHDTLLRAPKEGERDWGVTQTQAELIAEAVGIANTGFVFPEFPALLAAAAKQSVDAELLEALSLRQQEWSSDLVRRRLGGLIQKLKLLPSESVRHG